MVKTQADIGVMHLKMERPNVTGEQLRTDENPRPMAFNLLIPAEWY